LIELFVAKEDLTWAQVSVDHAFLVNELEQVNNLQADIDRFDLSEESRHAFLLATRNRVSRADRRSCCLLLDFHTGLLFTDVLFQAVARVFLDLAVDDTFG